LAILPERHVHVSKKSYIDFCDNFNFGALVFLTSLIVGELVCRRVWPSASLSVGELVCRRVVHKANGASYIPNQSINQSINQMVYFRRGPYLLYW